MNWVIYFLFASVSFANLTIAGEVYVIELAALITIFTVMLRGVTGGHVKQLQFLDIVVIMYAVFGILAVVSGADHIWESARYYRANVLTPTLIYVAFRIAPITPELFKRGLYLLLPMLVIQALLLIRAYIVMGGRQQFFEGHLTYTITLAALFVVGVSTVFFLRNENKSALKKTASVIAMLIIVPALYLTFSRTSLGALVLLTPLALYLWDRPVLLRFSGKCVLGSLVFFLFLLFSSSIVYKTSGIDLEKQRELQASSERLFSTELFVQDLTGRFVMWGRLVDKAMEDPILGGGGSASQTGHNGSGIASAHNLLVTVLLTSGLPGVLLIVLMINATYKCFNGIALRQGLVNKLGSLLWVSFGSLLMVAITGGLGGGRIFLFYALMGMVVRLRLDTSATVIEESEVVVNKNVLHKSSSNRVLRLKK